MPGHCLRALFWTLQVLGSHPLELPKLGQRHDLCHGNTVLKRNSSNSGHKGPWGLQRGLGAQTRLPHPLKNGGLALSFRQRLSIKAERQTKEQKVLEG